MTDDRVRIARARQAQLRAAQNRPRGDNPLEVFNTGVGRFGDAVVGTVGAGLNMGTSALGMGEPFRERPVTDAMNAVGIRTPEPRDIGGQAIAGAGDAAASLLPAAGVLRALSRTPGALGEAAKTILSAMSTRTGVTAEVAAGAGASVGAAIGEDHGGALGGAVGALAGGITAGGAVAGAPAVLRSAGRALDASPVVGGVARGVKSAVAPFTKNGANIIAEDMLRGATADRFAAAARLAEPNVGGLSVAQQTGDEGIMGIERMVAAADPQYRARLNQQVEGSRAALRDEITSPAQGRTIRDTKQYFQERLDTHRRTIGQFVTKAEKRLDAAMKKVQPGRDRESASIWATREIDKAFNDASGREAAAWAAVPKNVSIPTARAKMAYQEMVTEATRVAPETIPGKAHKFLGDGGEAFGDAVPLAEAYKLYSRVRRAGREAMALTVPDEETARRANKIAAAILDDIQSVEASSTAPKALANARAISTAIADKFGQGNVSRILARTRAGDGRIPDAEALRATVGQSREAGGVAVDDLRAATGGATDAPVQDFLRDEFITSATRPDGSPDPGAVERFTRNNREALSRFDGGVEREILAVRSAAREVVRRQDKVKGVINALGEAKRGTVAGMATAPKGREVVRGIFEAENPAMAARTIARAAQRDATGDAYLGLKAGLYDEIIGRTSSGGTISGERMAQVLTDPDMRRVLRAALPEADVDRLRYVASQFRKVERSLTAQQVDTENLPNNLISTFVQIQAAKAGRAMGTGTIQVPGMFTARARQILGRLFNDRADAVIREALSDPQVMSDLLIGPSASATRVRQAENRLMNWATGVLATEISED
jgi:hypothetical protein